MSRKRWRAAQRCHAERIRQATGLLLLSTLLLAVGCARVRPLSGGDRDESPPAFIAVFPADSTVNLDRTPVFKFDFDEGVDRASAAAAIRTYPHMPRKVVTVKGGHVTLTFPDSLPADTTIVIVIGKDLQDQKPRNNKRQEELWLLYSTGSAIRGGAVYGRVSLKGSPEPSGVVQYEPVPPDTSTGRHRPRYPVAAVNAEGLFTMLGIPAGQAFQLRGYADRNHNRLADVDELQWVLPETLVLADAEIRRGLEWNLIDPFEKATVEGVVINRSGIEGRIAIALKQIIKEEPADSSTAASDLLVDEFDGFANDLAADEGLARVEQVAGDSLFPGRIVLPQQDRAESGYETAYALLDSTGYKTSEWRIKYATPRGDFSLRVPPGRYWMVAFVDVSRDTMPGLYVTEDSTMRRWEPFWTGDTLFVAPGDELNTRSIDIEPSEPAGK